MKLVPAGNVVIPSIKAIIELGYVLNTEHDGKWFVAEKDDNTFGADDPIMLLGLIKLYEVRGENWRVSDDELEKIGREYHLL